jgi:hypothetical protein
MDPRGVLCVVCLGPLLAGVAVACAADPARLGGEPVTAPVACLNLPPQTPQPPASTAASSTAEAEASTQAEQRPSAAALSKHSDPCEPPCTGDTSCWIYVHRTRSSASAAALSADGCWPANLFDPDDDAGVSRRETRCLPSSARCPPGASGASASMTIVDGVMSKWNTCTWYDGP